MTTEKPRNRLPHRCDESCTCPVHGTPLIYWPAGDYHACQDASCIHGHGMNNSAADFLRRACRDDREPPEEAEKRRQAYASTEGGYLTREVIVRVMLGEFDA